MTGESLRGRIREALCSAGCRGHEAAVDRVLEVVTTSRSELGLLVRRYVDGVVVREARVEDRVTTNQELAAANERAQKIKRAFAAFQEVLHGVEELGLDVRLVLWADGKYADSLRRSAIEVKLKDPL